MVAEVFHPKIAEIQQSASTSQHEEDGDEITCVPE